MRLTNYLIAWYHTSENRVIKWMRGEPNKTEGCACQGKWDKYLETEHGPKFCLRSSHKSVTVHEV